MHNLANILTIFRLILLAPLVALFYVDAYGAPFAAFAVYAIGAITDFFDGWVARKFNQTSDFGRFLDPISDKIFVVAIMIMLVATGQVEGAWIVLLIVILAREFLVSGMREFLGPRNITLHVTKLAKWKTTVQMAALGLLILGARIEIAQTMGLACLVVATILTVQTGWDYLKKGMSYMDKAPQNTAPVDGAG